MTRSIWSLRQLGITFVHEDFYTASEETLAFSSQPESCWICGDEFAVGDSVTVAGTRQGNKLLHAHCYRAQAAPDA